MRKRNTERSMPDAPVPAPAARFHVCLLFLLFLAFAVSSSLALPCLAFAFASLPSHPAICPDFSPSPPPNQTTQTNTNVTASYGSKIPPHVLSDRLASYVHYFTLHGALRPFGASALIASHDPETGDHSLHLLEPSGISRRYYGAAAGKGRQPARTEMEKLRLNPAAAGGADADADGAPIDCREGVRQLARIIHALHDEGKDKPFELEMSWLCVESGWEHRGVPRDVIAESVEWAKKDIAEAQEEDDDSDDDEEDEMEE